MAIDVKFFKFAKRPNSTARPLEGSQIFTAACVLKADSGVVSPVIELKSDNPTAANYAFIEIYDRYYYINEWEWTGGLWTASLRCDALASWKLTIGASAEYIIRSAAASNPDLIDTAYPITNDVEHAAIEVVSPWKTGSVTTTGFFVVGVEGDATRFYAMSWGDLQMFFKGDVNAPTARTGIFTDEYAETVIGNWGSAFPGLKAELNPIQYIDSCRWFPFALDPEGFTQTTEIEVGWGKVISQVYDCTGGAGTIQKGSHTFTPAQHPQASRGRYLNGAGYSSYSLFFPPFGIMELDANSVKSCDTVRADWEVDLHTGLGRLLVYYVNSDSEILAGVLNSPVGVDMAIGHIRTVAPGALSLIGEFAPSIINGVALTVNAAMSEDNRAPGIIAGVGNVASSVIGAVGSYAQGKVPRFSSVGTTGGRGTLMGKPALLCDFFIVAGEDAARYGRPLCQTRTIASLGGYTVVGNPAVDIPCTPGELDEIYRYLATGFYYQ